MLRRPVQATPLSAPLSPLTQLCPRRHIRMDDLPIRPLVHPSQVLVKVYVSLLLFCPLFFGPTCLFLATIASISDRVKWHVVVVVLVAGVRGEPGDLSRLRRMRCGAISILRDFQGLFFEDVGSQRRSSLGEPQGGRIANHSQVDCPLFL